MGIFNNLGRLMFGKKQQNTRSVFQMPLWTTSYGENVFESDIVNACIHAIAEESSKMVLKSIKRSKDGVITPNNDNLTRLFEFGPNPLMTMKDMLYWSVWRLETKSNFYWVPDVIVTTYTNGTVKREVIGIYPIDSVSEEMYVDENSLEYYIRFTLKSGEVYTIPYKDVIHVRKHYGKDYFFGETSRKELLKSLKISDLVTELLPESVKASMQVKGILSAKSLADAKGMAEFKQKFESTIRSGETGFAVLDVAGEFQPVNINPQVVPADVLKHLEDKILKNFGVPIEIILGNANENTWSSFYQKNIEPIKIALEQAASRVLFTQNELYHGNRIKAYDKIVQHYTISTRLQIIKELGARGYLSRSEQRELAGYEPDGGPEKVSLNFVDKDKANEYQLGKEDNTDENKDDNTGEN